VPTASSLIEPPTNAVCGVTVTSSMCGFTLMVPFTATEPLPVLPTPFRRSVTDVVAPALTSKRADPVNVVSPSADCAVSVMV
jgi:hypothetical protein